MTSLRKRPTFYPSDLSLLNYPGSTYTEVQNPTPTFHESLVFHAKEIQENHLMTVKYIPIIQQAQTSGFIASFHTQHEEGRSRYTLKVLAFQSITKNFLLQSLEGG